MQLPIKRGLQRIPGGMMLVPLLAGAVLHTLAPGAGTLFGSFTGALFTGALPILAVFYVCMGSTIELRSLTMVASRGGALLLCKIVLGLLAGLVFGHLLGERPVERGWFAGLSTLAVVAALNDTNGGLYMALMEQFGRREEAAAYAVMSLESGPFLTMVSLGAAGLAAFPWFTLLGAVLPLAVGMLLGNLDRELRDWLGSAAPRLIPFFAFAIGCTLDLRRVWEAGLLGVALGLGVVAVSGALMLAVDRTLGGTGTAGLAAATTAANAAAVPALVAAAQPAYRDAAGPATVLVAACVIVSSLLTPVLTAAYARRTGRDATARTGTVRDERFRT